MTVAPVHEDGNIQISADGKLRGRSRHIPFARTARHIAVLAKQNGAPVVALVEAGGLGITPGTSLAGEPQDTVSFDGVAAIASGAAPGLDPAALSRLGEAASTGAAIAHQVHGAMGFTYEHSLHHATRRLWAWREEFGNETLWAGRLGRMVAAQGADALWPFITAGS